MRRLDITRWLADRCVRHPLPVIAAWLLLAVTGILLSLGAIGPGLTDVLTTQVGLSSGSESGRAREVLAGELPGSATAQELVIVRSPALTVDSPEFKSFTQELVTGMRGLEGTVAAVVSYYETADPSLASEDGRALIIPVVLAGGDAEPAEAAGPLLDYLGAADRDGFEVLAAGRGSIDRTMIDQAEHDARRGEMVGIPVALAILVVVFGALLAALIPLGLALTAIGVSAGIATLAGQLFDLNVMAANMISMIGLAVGIDYALFIIHRYREEREAGHEVKEAVVRTGSTANRAVLFSGGTVIVALIGLFIVPSSVFRSLAMASITVAAVAVFAALTLLPAVLSVAGDRIDSLRLPFIGRRHDGEDSGGLWAAVTRIVTTRPWVSAGAATLLLLAAAAPLVTMRQGMAGVESLPESTEPRQAIEAVERDFGSGVHESADVVIRGTAGTELDGSVAALSALLSGDPAFGQLKVQPNAGGDVVLVSAEVLASPESDAAYEAVGRLRGKYVPRAFAGVDAEIDVGGRSAQQMDFFHVLGAYTPLVFAFVLGVSFVLLLFVFRSVVVPVKALLMNLLSTAAAYGILVLVFQHGVGNELLGFQQTETIEAWLPLFLFAVLFGLSMDYHVFLLSRIRERFDQTGDSTGSIVFGMRTTSGIITGAALIMVAVFAGFAMGDLGALQQSGFGLAVAVILDATVVRTVLVPSSMQLLGRWNWYLPPWLRWMPAVNLEGPAPG